MSIKNDVLNVYVVFFVCIVNFFVKCDVFVYFNCIGFVFFVFFVL